MLTANLNDSVLLHYTVTLTIGLRRGGVGLDTAVRCQAAVRLDRGRVLPGDDDTVWLCFVVSLSPAVGMGNSSGLDCIAGMSCICGNSGLFMGSVDGGGLCGGGLDRAVSDFPAGHSNQPTLEETAGRSG